MSRQLKLHAVVVTQVVEGWKRRTLRGILGVDQGQLGKLQLGPWKMGTGLVLPDGLRAESAQVW